MTGPTPPGAQLLGANSLHDAVATRLCVKVFERKLAPGQWGAALHVRLRCSP
jgi:hypothetical protein